MPSPFHWGEDIPLEDSAPVKRLPTIDEAVAFDLARRRAREREQFDRAVEKAKAARRAVEQNQGCGFLVMLGSSVVLAGLARLVWG